MLPTFPRDALRLADVLETALDSIVSRRAAGVIGASSIVCLIDGLGWVPLTHRAGHARTMRSRLDVDAPASVTFPTTTVAQLASVTTGLLPGQHGLVGYSLRDPVSHAVFNLISGWSGGVDPESWQPHDTVFHRAAALGVQPVAIGPTKYAGSALSRAILRGSQYRGADTIGERLAVAVAAARDPAATLIYVYLPELDSIAHRDGWSSPAWGERLEEVDAVLGDALRQIPATPVTVTADHGMVDVDRDEHLFLDEWAGSTTMVSAVAGEPRAPQLYVGPAYDAAEACASLNSWLRSRGAEERAVALARADLIATGWLGDVGSAARERLGDVIVITLDERTALYDRSRQSASAQRMIGQHGSLTRSETAVPLLRFNLPDR